MSQSYVRIQALVIIMLIIVSSPVSAVNVATGIGALFSNTTGDYNVATGVNSLYSNTTGDYNTATGDSALYFNTTGSTCALLCI